MNSTPTVTETATVTETKEQLIAKYVTPKLHKRITHILIKNFGFAKMQDDALDVASDVIKSLLENFTYNPAKAQFTTYVHYRIKTVLDNRLEKIRVREDIQAIPVSKLIKDDTENSTFELGKSSDDTAKTLELKEDWENDINKLENKFNDLEFRFITLLLEGNTFKEIPEILGFENNGKFRTWKSRFCKKYGYSDTVKSLAVCNNK